MTPEEKDQRITELEEHVASLREAVGEAYYERNRVIAALGRAVSLCNGRGIVSKHDVETPNGNTLIKRTFFTVILPSQHVSWYFPDDQLHLIDTFPRIDMPLPRVSSETMYERLDDYVRRCLPK